MRTFKSINIRIVATLLFLLGTSFFSAHAMQGSLTTVEEISPGFFSYGQGYWFAQSQSYTEGGVTFTWPQYFTGTPMVLVSVSSDTYSSSGQVMPIVVDNSSTGCTVYVNIATLFAIGEAETDSFIVHVYAVEAGL